MTAVGLQSVVYFICQYIKVDGIPIPQIRLVCKMSNGNLFFSEGDRGWVMVDFLNGNTKSTIYV